jgi:hypothetical protein
MKMGTHMCGHIRTDTLVCFLCKVHNLNVQGIMNLEQTAKKTGYSRITLDPSVPFYPHHFNLFALTAGGTKHSKTVCTDLLIL